MLIDQPIPNLIGGVSQQSPQARFLNQVDEQLNALGDPVEGLRKRPPTEHVAKLIDGVMSTPPAILKIDRDNSNRYVATVEGGAVRVFDTVTGQERTVVDQTSAGAAYLTTATPRTSIRSLTVADNTFIINREVSVAAAADVAPTRPYEGLIFLRSSNYGKTYTVKVYRKSDDVLLQTATTSTPDGSQAAHATQIGTDAICTTLRNSLANGVDIAEAEGSTIYIANAEDFYFEVTDETGGEALKGLKDNVQRFSDLPAKAKEGIVLRVAGDQTSSFDDYYVTFKDRVWEETIKPGIKTKLDPATLPVSLVRQPDGSFILEDIPWVDRQVGDDDLNPFPSFVGYSISSMFYFRNRLGFLADENVILSQAGDYFNFFRTTVTQLLDGDPIDTPASDASGESSPVSILEHAVAFDKKLVLFARNAQFILGSNGVLTPFDAEIDPVTSFACSTRCRPATAGRYVYFAFDREGASGVREFFVDGASQTEDADEVTAHCPTYLPADMVSLTVSTLENVMIGLSEATPNRAYVYEFFRNGQEKLVSAWHTWEFATGDTILSIEFFDNVAYFTVQRADGVYLERMRFRPHLTDTGLEYFTLLDRRVLATEYTVAYDAFNDETVYTLPYVVPSDAVGVTLKSETNVHAPGQIITPVSVTSNELRMTGNTTAWTFVLGVPYTWQVELTRPYAMQNSQNGLVANTEAIVKVRDYSVDYAGSAYFTAEFTPKARGGYTKTFSGEFLGSTPTDIKSLSDGTFRIKTPTRNIHWGLTLKNDSPFPCRILAASWRGLVESKSQRV